MVTEPHLGGRPAHRRRRGLTTSAIGCRAPSGPAEQARLAAALPQRRCPHASGGGHRSVFLRLGDRGPEALQLWVVLGSGTEVSPACCRAARRGRASDADRAHLPVNDGRQLRRRRHVEHDVRECVVAVLEARDVVERLVGPQSSGDHVHPLELEHSDLLEQRCPPVHLPLLEAIRPPEAPRLQRLTSLFPWGTNLSRTSTSSTGAFRKHDQAQVPLIRKPKPV